MVGIGIPSQVKLSGKRYAGVFRTPASTGHGPRIDRASDCRLWELPQAPTLIVQPRMALHLLYDLTGPVQVSSLLLHSHNTKGSAYRVEAAESGNLAVWTFYAMIVKVICVLESCV
jgi:hypothetical protein